MPDEVSGREGMEAAVSEKEEEGLVSEAYTLQDLAGFLLGVNECGTLATLCNLDRVVVQEEIIFTGELDAVGGDVCTGWIFRPLPVSLAFNFLSHLFNTTP